MYGLYEIDKEFDDLTVKIENSKDWTLTWACRLSFGYVVEVRNNKTGEEEEKFTNTFGEMEYWVKNTLKVA